MGELAEYNELALGRDPAAKASWPRTLPIELAMRIAKPQEIREAYGINEADWNALARNPMFLAEMAAAAEMLKKEGVSFRLKAQMQADELLKSSWKLIHANGDDVPPSVKADLIKSTIRWAGYDNKESATANGGNQLNIQINLGGA